MIITAPFYFNQPMKRRYLDFLAMIGGSSKIRLETQKFGRTSTTTQRQPGKPISKIRISGFSTMASSASASTPSSTMIGRMKKEMDILLNEPPHGKL